MFTRCIAMIGSLAIAGCLSTVLLAQGTDCVVHLLIGVKQADGSMAQMESVMASDHLVHTLLLDPGDSIVVDPQPNGYCSWLVDLEVRSPVCSPNCDVVHELPFTSWSHPPLVFLLLGEMRVSVTDADYSASACLYVSSSGVGALETETSMTGFAPRYAGGLLQIGGHPGGELMVHDMSGRLLWNTRVATGETIVIIPAGQLPPGVHAVTLRTEQGAVARSIMVDH